MLGLNKENAYKKSLTQYVSMQHQLEVRLVWDKSVKKNLLCTVLSIPRIFWKYLTGHVYVLPMTQGSYSILCKNI